MKRAAALVYLQRATEDIQAINEELHYLLLDVNELEPGEELSTIMANRVTRMSDELLRIRRNA